MNSREFWRMRRQCVPGFLSHPPESEPGFKATCTSDQSVCFLFACGWVIKYSEFKPGQLNLWSLRYSPPIMVLEGWVIHLYTVRWNVSIAGLQIKEATYTDNHGQFQMVGHGYVYIPDLRIEDTFLLCIMDEWSRPKRSRCVVNELCNTVKATSPNMITSASTSVPRRSLWGWVIYKIEMPDIHVVFNWPHLVM
jgi:hypothetical protein